MAAVGPGEAPKPEDHVGLVYRVVADLLAQGWPRGDRGDMVGDGMVALILAARSYDPDRGASFPSYALKRIRWGIIDARRIWLGRTLAGCHPKPRAGLLPEPDRYPVDSTEDMALREASADEVRTWLRTLPRRDQILLLAGAEEGGLTRLAKERGVTQGALSHYRRKFRTPELHEHLDEHEEPA